MSKKIGLTIQDLKEKAVSKAQQRFMGMVAHGKIDAPDGLSKKDARKFAKTKHKGLPNRVDEGTMASVEDLHGEFDRLHTDVENMMDHLKGSKYVKEYNDRIHKAAAKFEDAEMDNHMMNATEAIGELESIRATMNAEYMKRRQYMAKYGTKQDIEKRIQASIPAHKTHESHVEGTYVPSFKEFMTGELFESTYSEGHEDEHFTGWNEWNVEVNSRHLGEHSERRVPGWDVILITHRMHEDHRNWVYAYWDERLGEGVVFKHPRNRKDVMQHIVEKHKSSGLLADEN